MSWKASKSMASRITAIAEANRGANISHLAIQGCNGSGIKATLGSPGSVGAATFIEVQCSTSLVSMTSKMSMNSNTTRLPVGDKS